VLESVGAALDGADETDLVTALGELDDLEEQGAATGESWDAVLVRVNQRCAAITNEFFRARLLALPRIEAFVDELSPSA
jgi:hypothetical protein